jgi:hypothetical protein
MKNKIEAITGIILSDRFKALVDKFEKHFGAQKNAYEDFPLEVFSQYLGIAWLAYKDDVRDNSLVPFEAELPFATGYGSFKGWLNLCPEIENFKKPFILWNTSGPEVWYCGTDEVEIIQNLIKYECNGNYDDIDLEFLESIGVGPNDGQEYQYISTELPHALSKIPLRIPEGYKYEMTIDGVGVITKEKYFAKADSHISRKLPIKEYLDLATQYQNKGMYGSSLFYLKEAYFRIAYLPGTLSIRLKILEMKKEVYEAMDRTEIAKMVHIEWESLDFIKSWVERNKTYAAWSEAYGGWNWYIGLNEMTFEESQMEEIFLAAEMAGIETISLEWYGKPKKFFNLLFPFGEKRLNQIKVTLEKIHSIITNTVH